MQKIILISFLLLVISCQKKGREERDVFIVIEKASDKDGLYLNLSDPDILYLQYSNEILRYFREFDKTDRKSMPYDEAYNLFRKRYKESYNNLFPSDFNRSQLTKSYNVVVIDTIRGKAFMSKVGQITVMY